MPALFWTLCVAPVRTSSQTESATADAVGMSPTAAGEAGRLSVFALMAGMSTLLLIVCAVPGADLVDVATSIRPSSVASSVRTWLATVAALGAAGIAAMAASTAD